MLIEERVILFPISTSLQLLKTKPSACRNGLRRCGHTCRGERKPIGQLGPFYLQTLERVAWEAARQGFLLTSSSVSLALGTTFHGASFKSHLIISSEQIGVE